MIKGNERPNGRTADNGEKESEGGTSEDRSSLQFENGQINSSVQQRRIACLSVRVVRSLPHSHAHSGSQSVPRSPFSPSSCHGHYKISKEEEEEEEPRGRPGGRPDGRGAAPTTTATTAGRRGKIRLRLRRAGRRRRVVYGCCCTAAAAGLTCAFPASVIILQISKLRRF